MSPHNEPTAGSESVKGSPTSASSPQATKTELRDDLVQRVRAALPDRGLREVRMFGGVSFMIDGRLAVAAGRAGDLLVRIDPARHEELRELPGARAAVMGTDRPMGPGWISVERPHLVTDDELGGWLRTALEFHAERKSVS